MRTQITISEYADGHFIGARASALPLRHNAEEILAQGQQVVFDFSSVEVTQSFIDELVGGMILRQGPELLSRIVFKTCSDNVRAIIRFVVSDRCEQYIKAHAH